MIHLPFDDNSFNTIYADCPWPERGGGIKGGRRGASRHYQLMNVKEIMAMGSEVKRIAGDNCHLYLWTTNTYFPSAIKVMEEWGFGWRIPITWTKGRLSVGKLDNPGLGQYYRGLTEHCLFGVRGVLPYRIKEDGKRAQGVTGFISPRQAHSVKPEDMTKMIELVSYPPYLEIFARRSRENWSIWGNEV